LFAFGCVGIIDNAGMWDDGGSSSSTSSTGTTVTSGTTGTSGSGSTSDVTSTGATSTGSSSTSATSSATTASTGAVGTPTTSGAGGAGGGLGGAGGAGSGSGGGTTDAGRGGSGTGGGRPDAGTVGGTTEGGVGGPTFAQVSAIVQRNCASCHRTFTTFSVLTTHAVSRCGNDMLAKPNDAANSAFLELVLGQCGTFLMPRACKTAPCISAADIDTFTAWINAGAPNN
jgi:hypothetical protein